MLHYWEQKENIILEAKIDQQEYNKDDLVEVKVPLNLPYHNNWKEFERFDGEIDIDGMHYKYVMRKVYNDSLILLCIPNEAKMKMQTARDEFFSLVADLQKDSGKKKTSDSAPPLSFKFASIDYICQQENEEWKIVLTEYSGNYYNSFISPLLAISISCPWQPPDRYPTVIA